MNHLKTIFLILTFTIILSCSKNQTTKTVGIIIINDFETANLNYIIDNIESIYKCKCVLLKNIYLPENCITTIKTKRYRADSIIQYLRRIKPDSVNYILGLTNENISNTKFDRTGKIKIPESYFIDISIFGLGFCPGKSCVVSSYCFKNACDDLVKSRLKKITIHELGHNFGLPHCVYNDCVMQDAGETVKILDESDTKLCQHCRKKISNIVH